MIILDEPAAPAGQLQMEAVFQITADGETSAHGTLLMHRAETNATKVFRATAGADATASCADTDGDGASGVVFLGGQFLANDGEVLDLSVTPTGGDIDEPGEYIGFTIITSEDGTVLAEAQSRILYLHVTAQHAARR